MKKKKKQRCSDWLATNQHRKYISSLRICFISSVGEKERENCLGCDPKPNMLRISNASCVPTTTAFQAPQTPNPETPVLGLTADFLSFSFFFLSSGGWGKIKLLLTTLPRISIRVVCRFNSLIFGRRPLSMPPGSRDDGSLRSEL